MIDWIIFLFSKNRQSRKKEDEKYKTTKTNLKKEMEQLRQQVLDMMKTNQTLPDIERLERFEFIMDTDERNAMLVEREKLLKEVSLYVWLYRW